MHPDVAALLELQTDDAEIYSIERGLADLTPRLNALAAARDRELAADPRRLAALAGALLAGVQLGANHWAFLYLAWLFPCLAVGILAAAGAHGAASRGAIPTRRLTG